MALTGEWRTRIEDWSRELRAHFVRPLSEIELSGFTTMQALSAATAAARKFKAMPRGTPWGGKWEYAWFRAKFKLPAEAEGQRVVINLNPGGEGLVFVNGQPAGARDNGHAWLTLAHKARGRETFEILMESYAGHGATPCWTGPLPPDRNPVPEPPPAQQTVGVSTLGLWQEEIYQLWLDVQTLFELREHLDRDSLRVSEIDAGLRDFTTLIDFEVPCQEFMETARAARARLRPLMQCVNGSTAPTLFAFGHGHLDVAWLWPLAETERKAARTLSNQIALAREYPAYRFMHSQAHLFWMVQQKYPEFYREVKQAVKNGQIIAEGGMWVEADTNLTGGESLIRQFLLGKRFFQEEFGVDCQMLWLPDVFGYSAALPQIMQGCGIRYFTTQKIFWSYHGGDPFPCNTFQWVGLDGSQVLVHLHNDYNSQTSPANTIQRWRERVQKDGIATRLMPFGWGDGGGGPERDHVEFALRQRNLEGCPSVRLSGPLEFFKDLEERGYPDNRYVGELYFQAHRGTYTTQARTKKGNRKCEFALREAELWTAAAAARGDFPVPADELESVWKKVLLNQFHDILPGSSIARVYEEAEAAHAASLKSAQEIAVRAQAALTDRTRALTVFNSLNWNRRVLVELPRSFACVLDHTGNPAPVQQCNGRILAEVQAPSCGWTSARIRPLHC